MKAVVVALGALGAVCLASFPAKAEDLTWCKQAISTQESKKFEQAVAEINRCIDSGSLQDSNLAVALHNRGIAFTDLNRIEDAVEDLTASLRLRPNHANTLFRRAHALHLMAQFNKAIDDYTAVLLIDPNDGDAYLYRGAAWHDLGQFARAVDDYTVAIRIDPNSLGAYYARSKAYESLGLNELAEKDRQASERN
jgi:tetratricopeptide (TPR) repeat protein